MKKQLTAEQVAARDARRSAFKELVRKVAAMDDGQRAEIVNSCGAVVTCDGHALSITNTMLLILQSGGRASMVGGFRQWLGKGRCVRKGEHGFMIWIPLAARKTADGADSTQASEAQTEGDSMRFGNATVFDITQTEELPAEAAA